MSSAIIGLLVLAALVGLVWFAGRRSESRSRLDMLGLEGVAQGNFSREGMILVRGELWRATARRGLIMKGDRVVVRAVEPGLLLVVEGVKDQQEG